MKKHAKLFLLPAIVCIITTFAAKAQNGAGEQLKNMTPVQRAAFQTNLMKTRLNLDADEVQKVKPINEKYATIIDALLKTDGTRIFKIKQAKYIQGEKDKELKTVFTSAQYKQYQDAEAEMLKKASEFMAAN